MDDNSSHTPPSINELVRNLRRAVTNLREGLGHRSTSSLENLWFEVREFAPAHPVRFALSTGIVMVVIQRALRSPSKKKLETSLDYH